jgi:polyhydroxyalkanoate synthesis repressor PhaR
MARTIKRYDNRKLYDLEAKRYVRLSDIADMIREGDEIVVLDNATGADITAQTLAKILSDREALRPLPPGEALRDLVRWSGDLIGSGKDRVGHWFDNVLGGAVDRAAITREVRRELIALRERVATLESLVTELEKETDDGSDNGSKRNAGRKHSGG